MWEMAWLKDLTSIVQSALTILAILAGGGFALYKLKQFRDLEPHLTISHAINHRPIAEGYVHIDVTAALNNTSRVRVEIAEGDFVFQQVAPFLSEADERKQLEAQVFADDIQPFMEWTVAGVLRCGKMNIEPGQIHQETVEIILPDDISTIAVHTFFRNADSGGKAQSVWSLTSVYDIMT